jgi:dienelactone hydrolase
MQLYGAEFNSIGVATFFVDHFTLRGVLETATDPSRVSRFQMGQDDLHALKLLRTHPLIDFRRIGVLGFSKGGTVALEVGIFGIYRDFWNAGLKFKFHVAMYPGCNWQAEHIVRNRARILLLLGEKDDWAPPDACLEYAERIRAAGIRVRVKRFRNAMHAWDAPNYVTPQCLTYTLAFRNCHFLMRTDGAWIDMNHGNKLLTTAQMRANALARCASFGNIIGANPKARQQAIAEIKRFVLEVVS